LDYNILMGKASSIIEEMKKKKLGNNWLYWGVNLIG
jgi:hypothetical protein